MIDKAHIFQAISGWCEHRGIDNDEYTCELRNTRYDSCRCLQQTLAVLEEIQADAYYA